MKYCTVCGAQLNDEAGFCTRCGSQQALTADTSDMANEVNTGNAVNTVHTENAVNTANEVNSANSDNLYDPARTGSIPVITEMKTEKQMYTPGLVLGIVSITGGISFLLIGLICGIIGLILSLVKRKDETYNVTPGLICSACGLGISSLRFVLVMGLLMNILTRWPD